MDTFNSFAFCHTKLINFNFLGFDNCNGLIDQIFVNFKVFFILRKIYLCFFNKETFNEDHSIEGFCLDTFVSILVMVNLGDQTNIDRMQLTSNCPIPVYPFNTILVWSIQFIYHWTNPLIMLTSIIFSSTSFPLSQYTLNLQEEKQGNFFFTQK